jgi:hypothetical protein
VKICEGSHRASWQRTDECTKGVGIRVPRSQARLGDAGEYAYVPGYLSLAEPLEVLGEHATNISPKERRYQPYALRASVKAGYKLIEPCRDHRCRVPTSHSSAEPNSRRDLLPWSTGVRAEQRAEHILQRVVLDVGYDGPLA